MVPKNTLALAINRFTYRRARIRILVPERSGYAPFSGLTASVSAA